MTQQIKVKEKKAFVVLGQYGELHYTSFNKKDCEDYINSVMDIYPKHTKLTIFMEL